VRSIVTAVSDIYHFYVYDTSYGQQNY